MTPETKEFIEELKREFDKSSLHTRTLFEMIGLVKLFGIIEEQEKEIERLKGELSFYATPEGVIGSVCHSCDGKGLIDS